MVLMIVIASLSVFIFLVGKSISAISKGVTYSQDTGLGKTSYKFVSGNQASQNKFLSIPIKGIILTEQDFSEPLSFLFPAFTYGYMVKEQILKAAANSSIKGIILEINSPGGTITGAKAISDGIAYYKEKTKKPVLAYVSGLGASGAYWVGASADKIIADSGSLTGSVGVIMGPFKYYNKVLSEGDLNQTISTENGIESFNITAGTDKDFGDPYKRISERAKGILQKGVNNEYEKFVDYISIRRNIPANDLKNNIGALAYDNDQALSLKLIDEIGTKDQAYTELAQMGEVKNTSDFQIITEQKNDFFSILVNTVLLNKNTPKAEYCPLCNQMLFLYGDPQSYILN